MSSSTVRNRIKRLGQLQGLQNWTVVNIPQDAWNTDEAIEAMVNYCLARWATSPTLAKNYAMTVRARLLTEIKPVVVPAEDNQVAPLSIDEEAKLSVAEIIGNYEKSVPPPPQTDYKVVEEE